LNDSQKLSLKGLGSSSQPDVTLALGASMTGPVAMLRGPVVLTLPVPRSLKLEIGGLGGLVEAMLEDAVSADDELVEFVEPPRLPNIPARGPKRGASSLKRGASTLKMALSPSMRLSKKLTMPAYQGFFSVSTADSGSSALVQACTSLALETCCGP